MTVQEAIKIFSKQQPNVKFKGYWKRGENIILNADLKGDIEAPAPAQFIVTPKGKIMPTNPVLSDLSLETMVPLKRKNV